MDDPIRDLQGLSMTEIVRLQNLLSQELKRRFERPLGLAFSDIAGSTAYFARFGDEAGRGLSQLHLDLLGSSVAGGGGRIVDTAGDGAFLAFPTADGAIASALAFQRACSAENAERSREHQLLVRTGLHFGSVLTDGTVVSGEAVNLCARVAASAQPGEIRVTRDLFREAAAGHRVGCRRLGPVALAGVPEPVELLAFDGHDRRAFPTRVRVEETGQEIALPLQDVISFGRLREHEETLANDVVLDLPDPDLSRQISRWHFEMRRGPEGYRLRPLSSAATEVDGAAITRGQDAAVRPGSRVRVAGVLTLTFLAPPLEPHAFEPTTDVR